MYSVYFKVFVLLSQNRNRAHPQLLVRASLALTKSQPAFVSEERYGSVCRSKRLKGIHTYGKKVKDMVIQRDRDPPKNLFAQLSALTPTSPYSPPASSFSSDALPRPIPVITASLVASLRISCTHSARLLIMPPSHSWMRGSTTTPLFPPRILSTVTSAIVSGSSVGLSQDVALTYPRLSLVFAQLGQMHNVRTLGAWYRCRNSWASPSWNASAAAFVQA